MGDLASTNLVLSDTVQRQKQIASSVPTPPPSKDNRDGLKLSPFPTYSFTTQFAGMSGSPSIARRRATLTPSQTWHHASGSFFAPELTHDDWIYRTTDTIPEASYSGSSTGSSKSSPDRAAVITPAAVTATIGESRPFPAPPPCSKISGVHYSSAHRREPSSPSFRSPSLPYPHAYFDRPPSPASSISSRSSEPLMGASLSLSELLAGTSRMSLGHNRAPVDERTRREEQRENRRQAMLERHSALIEQREKRRWSRAAQAGCIEWVESNTKW
ncbi:hypothetical protein RhiJN_02898 [Ceratobasidium sp. AG-Ba]|nr:hypothetical protein RhiJN_02898 [Ceratobasidium sp. AG-Ba]